MASNGLERIGSFGKSSPIASMTRTIDACARTITSLVFANVFSPAATA